MVAWFSPDYSGNFIAQQIMLCQKFQQTGNDTVMIFPMDASERTWCKELIDRGIKVRFIPEGNGRISLIKILMRLIKEEQIDILHSVFGFYDFPSVVACLCSRKMCVLHVRAESNIIGLWRKFKRMLKITFFYRKAYVIADSPRIQSDYTLFGMSPERTTIIDEGISFARLQDGLPRSVIRQQLGVSDDQSIFMMMGYHVQIKGVDIAVKAFESVYKRTQDCKALLCVVAGSGMEKVKKYVTDTLGAIPPWLRLLQSTEKIGEYYRAADVFISASRTEGFQNALIEASYMELPLIVSDIPALRWAQGLETCRVFPSENVEKLANCIEELACNRIQDQTLKRVKQYVQNTYSLDSWAEKMVEFYKEHIFK